ncbi:hypothetical protein [Abyssalbus ytuae]|uniref:ABM domain-containing protein n=1 Tax=Abyssalbus ytuae TaxID=2926907 RepID=A0A9E6ZM67_9FLAO|nr:hypothetical protein [Abyssalbus ytuae]UOB16755.1 hypothetical protein MQE35_13535 [Abyssalbus ytuae]
MIKVFVEHFLNDQGKEYFPSWINEASEVLKNYEGFIEVKQIQDINDEKRLHLLLSFKNFKLFMEWVSSKDHEDVLAKLKPYMLQKQKSQIFKTL